jgi:uncharacterized protein (DUF1330 family)
MPAFIVFTKEKTLDQSEMDKYSSSVKQSFTGHPVTFRAAYGRHQVLEGPDIEGAVILEFPDFKSAQDWYTSPAYTQAAAHRFKGATYRAFIVEGK